MHLASVNGKISTPETAVIPVCDEGLLRGDGAFEVISIHNGKPFALEDHYARLQRTSDGLKLPFDLESLRNEVTAILRRIEPRNMLLRLVVTRGGNRIAITESVPPTPAKLRVTAITHTPSELLDGLKTLSYAGNMLAVRIAHERGFDEALFVTVSGEILEGPTWSFFWGKDGVLYTPSLAEHPILRSITRERIMDMVDVTESACTLCELASADEAFLASTTREVIPIVCVDEINFPQAPGPLTKEAQSALNAHIQRELAALESVSA
jgi:branched-chain amino acid aminotransferase